MKIADIEASHLVPSLMTCHLYENVPEKVVGKPSQGDLLKNVPRENNNRLGKILKV